MSNNNVTKEYFHKGRLYIVFLISPKKYTIGYDGFSCKYFHDVAVPLESPFTGQIICNPRDLSSLRCEFEKLFDCEDKTSFSTEELKVLDDYIQTPEFVKYLKEIDGKKKLGKNYELLKISSIIESNEKEF